MIAPTIIIALLAAAGLCYLAARWVRQNIEDEAQARIWLAQRGFRIHGKVLTKVRNEDPDGWWIGYPRGKVRSACHARRLIERGQR